MKSTLKSASPGERHATFERQLSVMKMFSDNAKTYVQLSGLALGLTVTFVHEILHVPRDQKFADPGMIAMWSCFLLAIMAGAFYQYLAAGFMESCLDWDHASRWDRLEPGTIYGVMLLAFYGGGITFTVYACVALLR